MSNSLWCSFGDDVAVTLNGAECVIVFKSVTNVACNTPAGTDGATVDIVVSSGGQSVTLSSAFTYNAGTLLISLWVHR